MNFIKQIATILKMLTFIRSLFVLLLTTFSLHANDLIIEDFSVVTKLDGNTVSGTELGYLKDSQSVSFDVELWTTWDCVYSSKLTGCTADKVPFAAELQILAGGVSYKVETDIPVRTGEISYRNVGISSITETLKKNFTVTIPSTSTFHTWAASHYANGDDFSFRIIIDVDYSKPPDPNGNVVEDDPGGETNNEAEIASVDFVPLSGNVSFGGATATLDSFTLLKRDLGTLGCFGSAFNNIVRLNNAQFSWIPSAGWNPATSAEVDPFCASYVLNNGAFDLVGKTNVLFGQTQGTIADMNVTVTVTTLTTNGAEASGTIGAILPVGYTQHAISTSSNEMVPRGSRILIMEAPNPVGDYGQLELNYTGGRFIHSDSLPFLLYVTSISLNEAEGFFGSYDGVKYMYDVTYDIGDIRRKEGYNARSNDYYLSSPNSTGNFTINSSGLQTSIDFDAGSGRSHFPQTTIKWDPFTLAITNGKINSTVMPVRDINMTSIPFSKECGACDDLAIQYVNYTTNVIAGTGGVTLDGAMAGYLSNMANPAWGPYDIGQGKHIFTRLNDHSYHGIFYYPGFKATGSGGENNVPVTEYLMGMRAMQKSGEVLYPDQNYLHSSDTAKRGNHFMAGLNLGPEIYSDASGQISTGIGRNLVNTGMAIGFGGPGQGAHTSLSSSEGTKYVVRRSGVTGVFNMQASTIPAYGYTLPLSKLAFRQVNNALDDYNWMEGSIHVGGKADMDIAFDSLTLECDGNLGSIHILREGCNGEDANGNGIPDENCNMFLEAWQSPIELLSAGFASTTDSEPVCSQSQRQLQLGHTFDLAALDKQLVMRSLWSPSGEPNNVAISGESDVVFDRPNVTQGSEEDRGFSMVMDRGIALKTPGTNSDGWVEMNGTIGVPFWETLDVKARFANQSIYQSESVPSQTIVYEKAGSLSGSDDTKSNDELISFMENARTSDPFKAYYRWGNSSFGFGMPIFYEPGRYGQKEAPRFLGRTIKYDAVVLNSNSGVDFIDSESTKISFGASADFEKLRTLEIDLHVDVSDPKSVSRLDKYFCKLNGFDSCDKNETVKGPVSKIVSGVVEKINLLNASADSGIDKLIREGVKEGIDDSLVALGTDPFEEAARVMSEVQSLPQQAATVTAEALKEVTEAIMEPISDDLDSLAKNIYDELPETLAVDASVPPTDEELEQFGKQLDNLQSILNTVEPGLDQADNKIEDVRKEMTNLANKVHGLTEEVNQSITSIKDDILATLVKPCDFASDIPTNKVLYKIRELQKYSLTSVELLGVMDLETFAYILMAFTGVDLTGVAAAERELRELVAELEETIVQADEQLNTALCGEDYNTMLTESTAFLNTISAHIAQADQGILDANITINSHLDSLKEKITDSKTYLAETSNTIATFKEAVDAKRSGANNVIIELTASDIRDNMDDSMMTLSGGRYGWYDVSTNETFVKRVADDLRDPIDNGIAQISLAVGETLGPLASNSFYMNKDEFKDVIIDQIMNSQLIENVHRIAYINTTEIIERINNAAGLGFDQVNHIVQNALVAVNEKANELIQSATGEITGAIPLKAAKVDGYGLVVGNELERLHIGAEWTMAGDEEENSATYGGALDIKNRNSEGNGEGCYSNASSSFDAEISATGIPISIGNSAASIALLKIGFMIENSIPKGIFGQISIDGSIDFEAFELYNLNFGTGLSPYEIYLGASGGAAFDDVQLDMSFLVGKTCTLDLLMSMDPQVADFITFPGGKFNGAYARGGATIPVYNNGCALEIDVSADVGTWFLIGPPITFGGLVGGGAGGEVLCIGSLRGEVTAYGQKSGDVYTFGGEGFGVAGAGLDCDKHTWTSRSRSRKDKWCGTGDAGFKAIYESGWDVKELDTDAVN